MRTREGVRHRRLPVVEVARGLDLLVVGAQRGLPSLAVMVGRSRLPWSSRSVEGPGPRVPSAERAVAKLKSLDRPRAEATKQGARRIQLPHGPSPVAGSEEGQLPGVQWHRGEGKAPRSSLKRQGVPERRSVRQQQRPARAHRDHPLERGGLEHVKAPKQGLVSGPQLSGDTGVPAGPAVPEESPLGLFDDLDGGVELHRSRLTAAAGLGPCSGGLGAGQLAPKCAKRELQTASSLEAS